ncbi:MAG: hypothetical protein ABR958_09375 [Dehalococcoidales bacterium]
MRSKPRGTLQIHEDVKRLFMLAKPLDMASSDFLKGLLTSHAKEVREAQQRSQKYAGLAALVEMGKKVNVRSTCLGRPPGARDLLPRKRRTNKELARAKQPEIKTQT